MHAYIQAAHIVLVGASETLFWPELVTRTMLQMPAGSQDAMIGCSLCCTVPGVVK